MFWLLGDVAKIELQPEHQTAPSNFPDQQRVFVLQPAQLLPQALSNRRHPTHHLLVISGQFRDGCQGRPAGERVAGESGAVPQVEVLGVCGLGVETGTDRHQASAERLGKRENVRRDAFLLAGEQSPGPAEPGLDLVDNQQQAVSSAQVPGGGEVARRSDTDARFSLNDLQHERGKEAGPRRQSRFERLQVAERHQVEPRHRGAETALKE